MPLWLEVGLAASAVSSSSCTLLSAADGIVGRKRTPSRGGEQDSSCVSSCTADWRTSRGLPPGIDCRAVPGTGWPTPSMRTPGSTTEVLPLEREIRHVPVLCVAVDPDESLRELERFESCDVLRVINHEVWRRRGSSKRNGMPQ
uniref:Putative secreted protein n=1 Tax=Anopheles darlingi TaxID=43151 RepID=A0A2M4D507_ANODA